MSWFWKERPDRVHLRFKLSIQNVVLRVSRRKNYQMLPCGPFFLVLLTKCLSKYLNSIKAPSLPLNVYGCTPALRYYSFCKMLHFQCLTVFWILLCLNNCSLICTLTLYYTADSYWTLLRHIHPYWNILKGSSDD